MTPLTARRIRNLTTTRSIPRSRSAASPALACCLAAPPRVLKPYYLFSTKTNGTLSPPPQPHFGTYSNLGRRLNRQLFKPVFYSNFLRFEVVDMRRELIAGNRSRYQPGAARMHSLQYCSAMSRRSCSSTAAAAPPMCFAATAATCCAARAATPSSPGTQMSRPGLPHLQLPPRHAAKMPITAAVPNIRQFGMGTESLENFIVGQFPGARVLRWDADTTRYKGAHDLILDHFISTARISSSAPRCSPRVWTCLWSRWWGRAGGYQPEPA